MQKSAAGTGMRPLAYADLLKVARRHSRAPSEVEDLVQDALLEAVRHGRTDFRDPATLHWLAGVIRNKARLAARGAVRRLRREGGWLRERVSPAAPAEPIEVSDLLVSLPPALKAVAALALSGHDRREIAYLLALPNTALRQRVRALKRHLQARGIAMPQDLPGLTLELSYGRIREALLPALRRQGGVFASHDPDGHAFIIRRMR